MDRQETDKSSDICVGIGEEWEFLLNYFYIVLLTKWISYLLKSKT